MFTLAYVVRRETHCEFCDRRLPDWKRTLTPTCGADAPAVMNVNFDGRTYRCAFLLVVLSKQNMIKRHAHRFAKKTESVVASGLCGHWPHMM